LNGLTVNAMCGYPIPSLLGRCELPRPPPVFRVVPALMISERFERPGAVCGAGSDEGGES